MKLTKPIKNAIEEKRLFWWDYHHADLSKRTSLSGYCLYGSLNIVYENGYTQQKKLWVSPEIERAMDMTETMRAHGIQIEYPDPEINDIARLRESRESKQKDRHVFDNWINTLTDEDKGIIRLWIDKKPVWSYTDHTFQAKKALQDKKEAAAMLNYADESTGQGGAMASKEAEETILKLKQQGKSYQEITDFLNASGIPTERGGEWKKGTVGKIGKKLLSDIQDRQSEEPEAGNILSEIVNQSEKFGEPDYKQKYESLKKAYEAILKELDSTKAELHKLTNRIDRDKQKAEPSVSVDISGELAEVRKELKELKALFTPSTGRKTDAKTIDGWNLQQSGGYWRAFRRIAGKMQSVYIGKTIDIQSARQKIAKKEKALGVLSNDTQKDRQKTEPEKPADLLHIIRQYSGASGIIPIWKVREMAGMKRADFDRQLLKIAETEKIELVGGDPGSLTDKQYADSLKILDTVYLNIQYHGVK